MAGNAASRLGAARVIGFTVGDFAFNLYWQSISLYLLFFYTDAVGLTAGAAGLIYMIAYVKDPSTRSMGFLIQSLATLTLMIAALAGAVRALLGL